MKNKNSLIIVIVVLSVLIGLLGGYIISDKLIDKEPNKEVTNNNQSDINQEQDYDLSEAKKLMDKYKYEHCRSYKYIDDLSTDSSYNNYLLNYLALSNVQEEIISCESIYGKSEITLYDGSFSCGGERPFYEYQETLKKKKELFGNDSSLKKEFIGTKTVRYDFSDKQDGFIQLAFNGGGDCFVPIENDIESAKIKNNQLQIIVVEKEFNRDTYLSGKKEVISETKRKYTFKKQDTGYYLSAIELIK